MINVTPKSPYYSPYVGGDHEFPRTPTTPSRSPAAELEAIPNIPILVTAFLAILATGGPTYSFGVYATALKDTLGLQQSQLETLGAASFAAGFISWIPGLLVDTWGSQKALIVGGFCQFLGLCLYWTISRFTYLVLPEAWIISLLSFLSMLIFTSNNLVIGGVFKAIVISCGLGTKGSAVGVAKAYLGLGAGVFSSLFGAIRVWTQSDLDFLIMCATFMLLIIVFPASFALPCKSKVESKGIRDESTSMHYSVVYIGLFILALVVVGSNIITLFEPAQMKEDDTMTTFIPYWLRGVFILFLWIIPVVSLLFLPTKSNKSKVSRKMQQSMRIKARRALEQDSSFLKGEMRPLIPPTLSSNSLNLKIQQNGHIADVEKSQQQRKQEHPMKVEEDHWNNVCETPNPVPDLTLIEMLQTIRAWLFLYASTILVGAGTMLTINMGQMVEARGMPPSTATAYLAIFSVAQALARVAAGAVSESALQWKTRFFGISRGVPRTVFYMLSCALAVAGHFILAISTDKSSFLVGIILMGFSFGGLWPLLVLIVGDLFGTVNHGANYMFIDGFTCAVGTLSIAKFLTQAIYEKYLEMSQKDVNSVCYGEECFRDTHTIISCLCFTSFLASIVLFYMTRGSYDALVM